MTAKKFNFGKPYSWFFSNGSSEIDVSPTIFYFVITSILSCVNILFFF